MWTCGELRKRAWGNLKKYYWMAFLVCLVAGFLGGGSSSTGGGVSSRLSGARSGVNNATSMENGTGSVEGIFVGSNNSIHWETVIPVLVIIGGVILVGWAVAVVWSAFMGNPVRVGCCRFFVESRSLGASAGLGRLFYAFDKRTYLNVVKVMFLKNLFIFLWSLLLIIPGVIKAYQYAMVPYILADNPSLEYKQALATSKSMMEGHKFHLWVLHLSFIGWYLLGMLCCCIGVIFVTPYVEATIAELYVELRSYPCTDSGLML